MSEFPDTQAIKNLIEQYNNKDIDTLILLQKIKKYFKLSASGNNTDTVKK